MILLVFQPAWIRRGRFLTDDGGLIPAFSKPPQAFTHEGGGQAGHWDAPGFGDAIERGDEIAVNPRGVIFGCCQGWASIRCGFTMPNRLNRPGEGRRADYRSEGRGEQHAGMAGRELCSSLYYYGGIRTESRELAVRRGKYSASLCDKPATTPNRAPRWRFLRGRGDEAGGFCVPSAIAEHAGRLGNADIPCLALVELLAYRDAR
jgi:hypothetical protein